MEKSQIRLMLVEDSEKWIRLFEEEILLDSRFNYLGHAVSKETGVKMACDLNPDVVIMDIFLDQFSSREHGIEAAREIRIKTNSKIVFFTADDENIKLRRDACRLSFASGYIRKSEYKSYGDEIYNAISKSMPKESIIDNVRCQLTDTENHVLTKMIDGRIIGITDYSGMYSSKVISKHKTSIYNKFGLAELKDCDKEAILIKIFKNW